MDWYIFFRGKFAEGILERNLTEASIPYYYPIQKVMKPRDERMVEVEEPVFRNLIFLQTQLPLHELPKLIPGLHAPYRDRSTGQPAKVCDAQIQRFRSFVENTNYSVELLADPIEKFSNRQKVRVKSGLYAGLTGYTLRMRKDRKLVIALGNMACAITGIPHTELEIIT